jgi:rSAM/selenodomain-associated transferase 2
MTLDPILAATPNPRLSVVVPTLNEELRIASCLASIGSRSEVEVVVSDGGSTDATMEVVRSTRPDVGVVSGSPGRGGQLDRGARAASAERLLFVHADCILPVGWFEAVMGALDDEQCSLACFRLRTESSDGSLPGAWRRFWLSLLDLRSRGWGLPYGDQGFAIRREVFTSLGGFPDIPLMEDLALARGCRRHGRIRRLPLEIRTTARRFERHPIRSRLIIATFPTLFRLGAPAATLARWYGVVR